jgi:hypothetical protein
MPDVLSPLVVLLWFAAGLVVLVTVLPLLLTVAGLTRCRTGIQKDPAVLEPGDDPVYAELYRRLTELGLEPLGTCLNHYRFFAYPWRWSVLHAVFGSREQGCFACVYRLHPNEPLRVSFTTCFTDGAMAWTANNLPEVQIVEEDYVRCGVETTDLAWQLDEHRKVVASLTARGRTPDAHDSLPVLAQTLQRQGARYVRRDRRKWAGDLWLLLAYRVGFPSFVALLSLRPWVMPAGTLVLWLIGVLVYRLGRRVQGDERRHRLALSAIARDAVLTRFPGPQPQRPVSGSEDIRPSPPTTVSHL